MPTGFIVAAVIAGIIAVAAIGIAIWHWTKK